MKILQICSYYYPHLGGIEQVANSIANSIKEHEQKIICFNDANKNKIDEVEGVEVIRAASLIKVSSQPISLSFNKLLKNVFNNFKPDIVIFHYPNPFAALFLLKILKKYPNCKLVLYWHLDITKQKILGKFFNGQTKKLLLKSQKVVATSPNYIEGSLFLSAFKEKCLVIPNCVSNEKIKINEEIICRGEEIKRRNLGKTVCFAFGRHVPYKGLKYLIKASEYLPKKIKIYIGGKGELTKSLIKLAENDKKIEFLGKLSDEDLKAYLFATDIFCFPSITKNEAFGIALAEAMAFAKPSVTFTIKGSGVNFVSLDKITGIEVENKNSQAFAKAIIKLSKNNYLLSKYGQAAKERVEKLFTYEKFKDNILNLLKDLG